MTEILKGVPIPASKRKVRASKYAWDKLEIGDSFVMKVSRATAATQASAAGKKLGRKFITRELEDGSIGVWRVVKED